MHIDPIEEDSGFNQFALVALGDDSSRTNTSWNGRLVQTQPNTERLTFVSQKIRESFGENNTPKPLMGYPGDAVVRAEGGYSEREGMYGKMYIEMEFGTSSKESTKEANQTSKDTGEINSTDKDRE